MWVQGVCAVAWLSHHCCLAQPVLLPPPPPPLQADLINKALDVSY
jgi:hypothetical protein